MWLIVAGKSPGVLKCLDLDEDAPLSAELSEGTVGYDYFKNS